VLIQTTRFSLGFALLFLSASYMATSLYYGVIGRPPKISWGSLLVKTGLVLVAAAMLNYASQALRLGQIPSFDNLFENPTALVTGKVRSDFFGYIPAFTQWFEQHLKDETASLSWGQYTFAGPVSLLGLATRQQGLFTDAVFYENGAHFTNIYTYFRGLIMHFGLVGSLAMLFLWGCMGGAAYTATRQAKLAAVGFLTIYYLLLLLSVTSLFVYNNLVLASLGVVSYWIYQARRQRRNLY
jgi:oligosaccharide repeat unit polymerase